MVDLRISNDVPTLGPASEGNIDIPSIVEDRLSRSVVSPLALRQISDLGILLGDLQRDVAAVFQLFSYYSTRRREGFFSSESKLTFSLS